MCKTGQEISQHLHNVGFVYWHKGHVRYPCRAYTGINKITFGWDQTMQAKPSLYATDTRFCLFLTSVFTGSHQPGGILLPHFDFVVLTNAGQTISAYNGAYLTVVMNKSHRSEKSYIYMTLIWPSRPKIGKTRLKF